MIPESLSYSRLSTYELCPGKFFRIYVEKDPRPVAESALEGSLVHDVLEIWMQDRTKDISKLAKEVFTTKMDKDGRPAYRMMTSEIYANAIELLEAFSKRDDLDVKTLYYEYPFDIVLSNGVQINGRIDRVDEMPDGTLNLVDYKTTRSFMFKNEIEKSLQGSMYALASRVLFPGKKVKFTIDPLRFKPITVEFSDQFLDAMLDYIELRFHEIESLTKENAEYRLNRFCGYCQYRDVCPVVKDAAVNIYGEPMTTNLETCCEQVIELTEKQTAIKKLIDAYTRTLDSHMVAQGRRSLQFPGSFCFIKESASGASVKCVRKENV